MDEKTRRAVLRQWGLVVLACWPVVAGVPEIAFPQDRPAARRRQEPSRAKQRKRVAELAGYLLIVLALAVALLVALVVLWGFRVRRRARRPLPQTSAVDELWYLRPGKPRRTAAPDRPSPSDEEPPSP